MQRITKYMSDSKFVHFESYSLFCERSISYIKMTVKIRNELLDVVCLLQAPVQDKVDEPTFETSPTLKPLSEIASGIVQKAKQCISGSFQDPETITIHDESNNSIKDEFFGAIKLASQLSKGKRLETFNDFHQKCASHLINVLYRIPIHQLKQAIQYAQTKVNTSLLNYALSVAFLHRDDALGANILLPSHINTDPAMYFDMGKVTDDLGNSEFTDAKPGPITQRFVNIKTNFTATNLDPEHKVAYFREDIGINLHHRHWHEVYPFRGAEIIVRKDRRGELFYYMHQQMIARFNFERFSNGLPRAVPYADFREPIEEAYFPKLNQLFKTNQFSSRPANSTLKDLQRENFYITLATMERWRDRIFHAIDRGYAYVIDPNTKQEVLKKIDEETGIDELGSTIEAAEILSWNYRYYGDLHNKGHIFFSYVHDPDHRFREGGSVMSYSETAMRDPIFYRWHTFIDDIFQHYKRTLSPYTLEQRQFKGINIEGVKILPEETEPNDESKYEDGRSQHVNNVLKTYWEKDAVDITQGVPSQTTIETREQVFAVFTHLQHEEFEYEIKVTNTLPNNVTGTVRIFLAPHQDESEIQMTFNAQRRMFIEMDKFTAQLDSNETTTIKRKSTESSVTIPFEKTFMSLSDVKKLATDEKLNEELNTAANGYCGCGWPHHMLVGKGTTGKGLLCDLFVMITNYEEDKVDESPLQQKCCERSSLSYCGVRNKKYPDRKPMGFPFDRDIVNVNATINDFMTEKQEDYDKNNPLDDYKNGPPRLSNMIVAPVRVRHEGGLPKCGKSLKNYGYSEENCKKFCSIAA